MQYMMDQAKLQRPPVAPPRGDAGGEPPPPSPALPSIVAARAAAGKAGWKQGRRRRGFPSPSLVVKAAGAPTRPDDGSEARATASSSGATEHGSGPLLAGSGAPTGGSRGGRQDPPPSRPEATTPRPAKERWGLARPRQCGDDSRGGRPVTVCDAIVGTRSRLWRRQQLATAATGDGDWRRRQRWWLVMATADGGGGSDRHGVRAAPSTLLVDVLLVEADSFPFTGGGQRRSGRTFCWWRQTPSPCWWRAMAQRRFAEAVAGVGGSGDGGRDCGSGGDIGGGEGVGCEARMATARWLGPRAWETAASGLRGIVWWKGRRPAWRREAQPMAAEAGSAREARAAEMEAGLAREAQPMEGGRIGARGASGGGGRLGAERRGRRWRRRPRCEEELPVGVAVFGARRLAGGGHRCRGLTYRQSLCGGGSIGASDVDSQVVSGG
uniref:Uncharacterized protein n=1 Tax=Oryza sativa subsp. japonica TaxID=39947 RepID=Q9FWE2_ORYSJ|nr:hypothetical protein [Oryza sativa Japonica Group]